MQKIDNQSNDDNRNYSYLDSGFYTRAEFSIICDWINEGAKIIDLGCGNGSLMKYVKDRKKIEIEGIEISESGVSEALKNGLKVKQGRIDDLSFYKEYSNNHFDYAICNVTLQMVMFPEILIKEMKRISKYQIISFPNFAYIGNRLDLLFFGRMPKQMLFGYEWYNTGHIHQLSVGDFNKFSKEQDLLITRERHLGWGFLGKLLNPVFPNFFSKIAIYLCKKG